MTAIADPFGTESELEAWGRIPLGDTQFPGIVTDVDGVDRPIDWVAQNGIGITGAALVYKGKKLVEGIKVTCDLVGSDDYQAHLRFNDYIHTPDGQKPKAHTIGHPAFATVRVAKVVFAVIPSAKYAGKRRWRVVYELKEYKKPVPAPTGQADPAKVDGPPKPKDQLEAGFDALLKQIEAAGGT